MIELSPNGRSETDDLFRGGIPVAMGTATYQLRPLSMDGTDEWEVRIRDVLAAMFGQLAKASGGVDGILGLYRASVGAELDALYAYDELGGKPVLPDRVALRATASRDDVHAALWKLVQHEFPLLRGMELISNWVPMEVREIVTKQLIRLLPESASPPSTSGSLQPTLPSKRRRPSARR